MIDFAPSTSKQIPRISAGLWVEVNFAVVWETYALLDYAVSEILSWASDAGQLSCTRFLISV